MCYRETLMFATARPLRPAFRCSWPSCAAAPWGWALAIFAVSAVSSDIRADVRLGEGGGVVDEVVADTATLAPVRARIPFSQFRYAHVDEAENVTFIADDPFLLPAARTSETHGIYRSRAADGEIECIVGPDTPMPGSTAGAWLRGLQSDGPNFVFHGRTRVGDPERVVDGLYAWSERGGVVALARTGDPAPGGGVFEKLAYGAIDDGRVVFAGLDDRGRSGLFAVAADGTGLARLIDNAGGGVLPAPAGGLSLFWFQPWQRDGALAFGGLDGRGREGVWFMPWEEAAGAAALPERPAAPSRLDLARLPVPEGVTLNYVETTSTSRGWIAFNAGEAADPARRGYGGEMHRGATRYEGVFLVKGDVVINIADTETYIPGREGETFVDFDFWTACDAGRVVFVARGRKGFRGVYLYDVAETTLYPVATTDVPVDGLRAVDFEVGARPLVGERCALAVRFAKGQRIDYGVYLATLHRGVLAPLRRGADATGAAGSVSGN